MALAMFTEMTFPTFSFVSFSCLAHNMPTAEELEDKLKKELETIHCAVEDISDGCGSKFKAIIVTPRFEGMPLLQRQRMVNSCIEEEMKSIHAFQMKTWTPEQWEKNKTS